MNLIALYKKALSDLEKSHEDEKESIKATEIKKRTIHNECSEKVRELEAARNKAVDKINEDLNLKKEKYKTEREAPTVITSQVKTLLKLMGIIKDPGIQLGSPEVYFYSNKDTKGNYITPSRKVFIDPIKTLLDNMFAVIKLYVVPNGKPTNKYSLVIRGYHIFGDLIRDNFRGNVNRINETHCNIKDVVKETPTENELLDYANNPKNLPKIMALLPIEELNTFGEQYHEAMKLLKDIEWQILYYEDQKNYYENYYSNGTETPEYAAILENLKQLKMR